MSDTFDHELEAFERWENGECDAPDNEFRIHDDNDLIMRKTNDKRRIHKTICSKSNLTVEQLKDLDQVAISCYCGEKNCQGWQMITDTNKQYRNTIQRGNKILEKIMPELNRISNSKIRTTKDLFRRKEDCEELALALGLYDETIEAILV